LECAVGWTGARGGAQRCSNIRCGSMIIDPYPSFTPRIVDSQRLSNALSRVTAPDRPEANVPVHTLAPHAPPKTMLNPLAKHGFRRGGSISARNERRNNDARLPRTNADPTAHPNATTNRCRPINEPSTGFVRADQHPPATNAETAMRVSLARTRIQRRIPTPQNTGAIQPATQARIIPPPGL
jgi:hypothetical protein